jgi:O-antigen biosynthesis protein
VVVGRVTGYDEYIEDGVNALVVDPLVPQQATAALRRILSEPDLRESLVRNGARTAAEWQWEPSIDALEKRFRDVVAGTEGVRPSSEMDKLAQSAAFFYGELRGIVLVPTPPAAAAAVGGADAEATAAGDLPGSAAAADASVVPTELGATERMLGWLRNKWWFRAFATAAWRGYRAYRSVAR